MNESPLLTLGNLVLRWHSDLGIPRNGALLFSRPCRPEVNVSMQLLGRTIAAPFGPLHYWIYCKGRCADKFYFLQDTMCPFCSTQRARARAISGTVPVVRYRLPTAFEQASVSQSVISRSRAGLSRRGEALWERVEAGSGSLGAASSESTAGSGRLRACGCSCHLRLLSRSRFRPSRGRVGVSLGLGGWL